MITHSTSTQLRPPIMCAHCPCRVTKSKGGISWPVQELTSDPVAKFFRHGSRLSWHYNWNKNWDALLPKTTPGLHFDAEFIPMIFAPRYLDNEFKIQHGYKHILGFNEPDHRDPAVANYQTPSEAAAAWSKVAQLRTSPDIKLISPAVAFDIDWLKEWFNLIQPQDKPDYLAIHVYTTTFEKFQSIVKEYYRVFGLPIVVTEFAMHSFDSSVPPPRCMQQVHDFMGQTTQWLDETDWVIKYAWFGSCIDWSNLHGVHPFNRLMDETGEITPLGHQYMHGGHD